MSNRDFLNAAHRSQWFPGVGWDCFSEWIDLKNTVAGHVRQFGYEQVTFKVDGLSSSANNARQIRDAIVAIEQDGGQPNIVLIGHSRGAPDILQTLVSYPEVREHIAAVISVAGAVGGSPLANDATQS